MKQIIYFYKNHEFQDLIVVWKETLKKTYNGYIDPNISYKFVYPKTQHFFSEIADLMFFLEHFLQYIFSS